MTNTSITVHRGPWLSANNTANNSTTGSKSQSHSRSTSNDDEKETESPALRFMERYINAVDSPDRSTTPWNDYYAEMAVYHDTKGDAIIGGWKIWDRINRLLTPFSSVHNEPTEIRIVPCDQTPGNYIVYGQFLTHFLLRGDLDEEEILVPKLGVWTLGLDGVDDREGLRILDVKQFYDNAVIGRYVTEKRKREAKKRRFEGE